MLTYSIVSYFHVAAIFVLFSSLIVELTFLKKEMTKNDIRIIAKADLFFGIFAGVTVVFGLLRLFYFGKGIDYYLMNPLFIIKISAFILVGLLSIYPTITFIKTRKTKEDVIKLENFKIINLIILFEITILLIIPFLAVLVTNGLGI
jgi:putative membrane protein